YHLSRRRRERELRRAGDAALDRQSARVHGRQARAHALYCEILKTEGAAMPAIERVETPISMAELERRWAAVRQAMTAQGIDALVTQNSSDWLGGYVKWFTDVPAHNDYPRNVIFHRDDLMTVVEMGNKDRRDHLGGKDPLNPGIGEWVFSPSFFSVGYTHEYDAVLVAQELKRRAHKTVGWVGRGRLQYDLIRV